METLYPDSETGCCPRFDPEPWDGKEHHWQNKCFMKDRVKSVFHIPLNFGKVMVRCMEKIQQADALTPEPLLLVDENSLWGAEVYIAVSKDVPDADMTTISGTFRTKVFEGPYKNIRSWISQMNDYLGSAGETMKKLYFFYTTCPKCAKHYGKNYVVLVAEV
jgi:hypothetical protein